MKLFGKAEMLWILTLDTLHMRIEGILNQKERKKLEKFASEPEKFPGVAFIEQL